MSIGKRIKDLRTQHNFTLEYVGGIIGASKQNLYKYENEIITNIPSDKIEKMAVLYGVSPCYIMGWDVPPKEEPNLSDQEQDLLKDFRDLNPEGQSIVTSTAKGLTSNPLYKAQPETEEAPPEAADEKETAASSA